MIELPVALAGLLVGLVVATTLAVVRSRRRLRRERAARRDSEQHGWQDFDDDPEIELRDLEPCELDRGSDDKYAIRRGQDRVKVP